MRWTVQHVNVNPVKDEEAAHAVATAWRSTLREMVKAIAEGDYGVSRGIPTVAPVSSATAEQIRASVAGYGETLTELPEETWNTSVAQWMGTHWDVLVDLSTAESRPSDLVLHVRVLESPEGFRFEIDSVHVP